jgi:indolepyruvate ferredoxin oxidoreductase
MALTNPNVTLDDKYALDNGRIFLTGIQALVRLTLMQRQRDAAAGLNTAGFISGYRGSPLGGVDQQLWSAKRFLEKNHIHFQPGVNEDLAATAVWGCQQSALFPGARYDGVFGMWYGKGPGVDRCGDVFKHANAEGTAPHGGVLAIAGDDHTCKSSTLPHQSEYAFMDAMMPVLNPSNVQEILDFGILGWALSRYCGCWVGFKTISETADSSSSVYVGPDRIDITMPEDFTLPEGGLNIRLGADPMDKEELLHRYRLYAAMAFARSNGLNEVVIDSPNPRLGIITTGKSYLDVQQALADLGIDSAQAAAIGMRVLKVGMTWPLDMELARSFAQGLDEILVVEEKRAVMENQLKEQLYNREAGHRPTVVGKFDQKGEWILPSTGELTPARIARVIASRLQRFYHSDDISRRLAFLEAKETALAKPRDLIQRTPYFCSGCPHNTSTRVPKGSEGGAGIGCHYMVTWMDRNTFTFTHMGGEGATWIGRAPFTDQKHIFQNLGDGTYFHSGHLAIRAAVAAGINITYKILYNDAVAMTGGQPVDGTLTVEGISHQLHGEGVRRIVVVSDQPDKYPDRRVFADGVTIHHRDELEQLQLELRRAEGVSILIYDQTCAAEKRRRRKRGLMPDPPKRVFINELVCEGCGDCGVQSNCLSVIPVETGFGRKRTIDQSSCNKDYSCLKGFCPSFVTVRGGRLRKPTPVDASSLPALPQPGIPDTKQPYNILITGVGGTGVVTIGAILGMAAHLEGKGCSVLDMTGLAQKYGAVTSHLRIADAPEDLASVRIAAGGAQFLIGCDLVVAAGFDTLSKLDPERSFSVVNEHQSATAELVRHPDIAFPAKEMRQAISDAVPEGNVRFIDATRLAKGLMGDAIASNLLMVGYAWQLGKIPLSLPAIERAIELNHVAVDFNKRAFEWGRLAAHDAEAVEQKIRPKAGNVGTAEDFDAVVRLREEFLTGYQNRKYAERYRQLVELAASKESAAAPGRSGFSEAIARSYFKLLAYKDEYEVARLFTEPQFMANLEEQFEGDFELEFNLAPAWLSRSDKTTGLIRKKRFGPWILRAFRQLARCKGLRSTIFDPFGYARDRRLERRLITDFENTVTKLLAGLNQDNYQTAVSIAQLPMRIRGFGHIKQASAEEAAAEKEKLWPYFNNPEPHRSAA